MESTSSILFYTVAAVVVTSTVSPPCPPHRFRLLRETTCTEGEEAEVVIHFHTVHICSRTTP